MPDLSLLIMVGGVLLLWLVVGLAVRRWGPGVSKHLVRCPETKSLARVSFVYKEAGFGSVQATDVTRCSLFGSGPVACDKHCLSRA